MDIALEGVSKTYLSGQQQQTVLRDVSVHVGSGRFVALLGRSGSGKSTLLNLMAGFDAPTAGHIRLGDLSLGKADDRERTFFRRRHIGFVFQAFNLLPTLTVSENVLLPLDLLDVPITDARSRVAAALDSMGLSGYGDRFPEELSGGEQQRVALARALVHQPAVVLADEPTGNLDLANARQVVELLNSACRDAGMTLVMATHSREIKQYADEVLEMRDGQLVAG
ncbi:MAG: ABC transporter ATP-binding protein [Pseudomonadota bacterium]